jgi:DNA polymerase eta
VSLDPYREQSRRILACIKEALPANLQKVEKASIDEVFLDLSAHIHSLLLERYPELRLPAPYDDQTENLPLPSTTALDWQTDALVDLDAEQAEEDDPDWDDITMFIGSELVRHVRGAVREQLKYTMSAGVAQNKMLSKLGSAHRKPNQQTVIRNRAVQHFLSDFKFTKIRNLGGKLGEQVVATFGTDLVKDLLPIGIEVLKQKLGDETGTWLYQTVRGIDTSEVNPRTQIKSMLSAKSFRPSINSFEQAARWLQIFVCDIYSRLVEAGVLEHKRRPKTLTLHHRRGGQVTQDISRQGPIHQAKVITEASLLELAKKLMNQIIQEGNAWPCINLSLSVGGFEDAVKGNMGIDSFLVTGEQARAMKVSMREAPQDVPSNGREKRPRRDVGPQGVLRFFKTTSVDEENDESNDIEAGNGMAGGVEPPNDAQRNDAGYLAQAGDANTGGSNLHQQQLETYFCPSCNRSFDSEAELQSHQDWHFAKSLQEEERNQTRNSPIPQSRLSSGKKRGSGAAGRTTKGAGHAKHDKGQSKLSFK